MNKIKSSIAISVFALFLIITNAFADEQQILMDKAVDLMKNELYSEARSVISELSEKYPEDPNADDLYELSIALESEPDKNKRMEILMNFNVKKMMQLADEMDALDSDLVILNRSIERLNDVAEEFSSE